VFFDGNILNFETCVLIVLLNGYIYVLIQLFFIDDNEVQSNDEALIITVVRG
jgi:hypothetical protein